MKTKKVNVTIFSNKETIGITIGITVGPRGRKKLIETISSPATITGERARRQLHKNAASNIEQVLEATPQKAPIIRPPTSHHANYPS